MLAVEIKFCLLSNLKASKRGWKRPQKDTLFGPTRKWIKPITLRSNNVKKATVRRISKTLIVQVKRCISTGK